MPRPVDVKAKASMDTKGLKKKLIPIDFMGRLACIHVPIKGFRSI